MNHHRLFYLTIFSLAILAMLAGCSGKTTQSVQVDKGAIETEVSLTVVAQFTQTAEAFTPVPPATPTPTPESIPPTDTPLPPTSTTAPIEPTPTQQVIPTQEATPTQQGTPTQQATPTTVPAASGSRIWFDDFEGENNWFIGSKEDSYTFEYIDGTYRIYNNLLGSIVWSVRGDKYTDVRLEVDSMKLEGPSDGYYGLICRYVDPKNYYALVINDGGYFGIVKMETGKLSFLQEGEIPTKALKDKDEYNRIRVNCIGTSLALYVNDTKVIEAQDDLFPSGDVGIGAGNQLVNAGIDVVFDNFEIWQP